MAARIYNWSPDPAMRSFSEVELSGKPAIRPRYKLLTFLSAVQALKIDILPITWQGASHIAVGGTSIIKESLVNVQASLVFKCFKEVEKLQKSEDSLFQTIISEIGVLGQRPIREHPNIVQLQGICWDISTDDKVWPALVFQKSQYGDLSSFLATPIGRELDISARLQLCMNIGNAILDMHSKNIIHGDIKPENVLIFKADNGLYYARVTDFGYSSLYADENDTMKLPISRPWNAPEHIRLNRAWKPSQAKRLDIFSFGMLCIWILFERYFSGTSCLPQEQSAWATEYFLDSGTPRQAREILVDLKNADKLLLIANQLLAAELSLNDKRKSALEEFLRSSLIIEDEDQRDASIQRLFNELALPQLTNRANAMDLDEVVHSFWHLNFMVEASISHLYLCDFRVRSHIISCLERDLQMDSASLPSESIANIALQVAICYAIGFGIPRDEDMSLKILRRRGLDDTHLNEAVTRCISGEYGKTQGSLIKVLFEQGHLEFIEYGTYYIDQKNVALAEERLGQEARDLGHVFGEENDIALVLRWYIFLLYRAQGRWKEAEELGTQLLNTRNKTLDMEHPVTVAIKMNLAAIYSNQGRWKEAEELMVLGIETNKRAIGAEHPTTLAIESNLVLTYSQQGRWEKAKELEIDIMDKWKRLRGADHPSTLTSMANLATIYRAKGQWGDAEKLELQVKAISTRVLGQNHPDTVISIANLASTYANQGKWLEAEELNTQMLNTSKSVLGAEHPHTLTIMVNLASVYRNQGQWKKAEDLFNEGLEARKRVIGEKHPDTLLTMNKLAMTYWNQGRWKEAENLFIVVSKEQKQKLGNEHPDTMDSIAGLATTYLSQGKLEVAEKLEVEFLQIRKKVLGEEHPSTLRSIANLASIYQKMGDWEKAESYQKDELQTCSRVQGPEHPETIASMANLASTYSYQGKLREAEEIGAKAFEIGKRVLGGQHQTTLSCMANLAATYVEQKRWEEAEVLQIEELRLCELVAGSEHPDTLASMGNLAMTYKMQGRLKEAEVLEIKVLEGRKRILGKEHPDTLAGLINLVDTYTQQGQLEEAEKLVKLWL